MSRPSVRSAQRAVNRDGVPVALVEVVAGRRSPAWAARSCSASSGSHLTLTLQRIAAPSRDRANILPATLNTDVSGPNGNVSSEPRKVRHRSLSASPFTGRIVTGADPFPGGVARRDRAAEGGPRARIGAGLRPDQTGSAAGDRDSDDGVGGRASAGSERLLRELAPQVVAAGRPAPRSLRPR